LFAIQYKHQSITFRLTKQRKLWL